MKEIVERTGGMAVQTDTFTNPVFKDSFKRMFAREGDTGFLGISSSATFEVGSYLVCYSTIHNIRHQICHFTLSSAIVAFWVVIGKLMNSGLVF